MSTGEKSLSDTLKLCWSGRVYIGIAMAAGLLLGVFLQLTLTPRYEARMIIGSPTQSGEERSLTILNENAASSRMMSVSSQVSRDYTKFQQTFREVSASRILAKYQGLLDALNRDTLFSFSTGPEIGDPASLSSYIKRHVTIDPLGATNSQVITYRHADPLFAEKFLRHLHKVADEMIRNDARRQTETRIAYLQKALREVQNPEHRKALTDQLMLEERQMMVISMDQPFAAEIIEPSSASSKPVWPRWGIVLPVCILIGAFLGFLLFTIRQDRKK
ncbi:MAG: hypothetical protein DI586_10470 [Micavibrio aeruginosavorus]|uniref:Chain length determinant protein n=1 Tax=Micavibrio aeruginosavorus TaxID=349221 RepID=A0A2W5FJL7_9BACT|nr:MAG: hypothetical protein DI586_10470 [Micavibrio aeruginosavorus]